MHTFPSVHIISLDTGEADYFKKTTLDSLYQNLRYPGPMFITEMRVDKNDPGGGFLKVAASWVDRNADIVGFIPSGFMRTSNSIKEQVMFMHEKHLVGCYGDVCEVKAPGDVLAWEEYPEFKPDMIGIEAIPMETFLFDFKKFNEAGGLNHLLAGSYRPNTFITTMMATVGQISRMPKVLVERFVNMKPWGYKGAGVLAWDSDKGSEFWRQLKFDKFVLDARQFYKTMGWR